MLVLPALAAIFVLLLCLKTSPSSFVEAQQDSLGRINVHELLQLVEPNLLSEDNNTNDFAPWSYKPICTRFIDSIGSKLCVYTSSTFGNYRGLSVFTTPEISRKIAASVSFRSPKSLADHALNVVESRWYTKPTPGKGLGMFAGDHIRPGERVTANTPILIAYTEGFLPKAEREEYLRIAVDQLPGPTKKSLLELSTLYDDREIPIQGIISGNAFDLQIDGNGHLAVFPEASRINHACSPNSQFRVDSSLLSHYVVAVRSIDKDEEITIAYSNPLEDHAQRQQHLKQSFDFTCRCLRCSQGQEADAALNEIAELQLILSDWTPSSEASIKKAEKLVKTYQDLGLEGYMDPAYCHAALMYNSVGSIRGAKKYIDLAIEANKLRLGPKLSDLGACDNMVDEFQSHWSWRRRKPV
ncbi:hypothetical protein LTR84_012947 [Exophiala bonariae]|uniref:SET domain-containing protein n=1 Tax=Exophiala bonariae TaxID=1690606 RepID=A0AAV9NFN3_9EURO|nr:hypothetical protein LTR84_012947 [Exophiala bonariae]